VLSAHFDLSEAMFSYTRRWQHLALDQWPMAALVFALSLVWVCWRLYRQALTQLEERRRAAEMAQQNVQQQESERKHLARELHDELGQYLHAIRLDAVAIRDAGGGIGDSPAVLAAARTVLAVDHAQAAVSEMIRHLESTG
jgi:glucose-6-phosphate-specific signal transduction histidine kinase